MEFAAIKKRLTLLDSSHLCDANSKVQVLDKSIKPITLNKKMIGIAHTVNCAGDILPVLNAITIARPDEILVINTNNSQQAVVGEIFATAARQRKIAGIIIDGACRDSTALNKMDFCIYAKHTNPQAGTKQKIGENQIPIHCGEVLINPGDIIFADADGIIVIPPNNMLEILEKAENIRNTEAIILEQISRGKSLFELTNFVEHYANITKENPEKSIFKFTV